MFTFHLCTDSKSCLHENRKISKAVSLVLLSQFYIDRTNYEFLNINCISNLYSGWLKGKKAKYNCNNIHIIMTIIYLNSVQICLTIKKIKEIVEIPHWHRCLLPISITGQGYS